MGAAYLDGVDIPAFDLCVAGAGVIGLSIAIEMRRRGATVAVFDRGMPLAQASTAAAGMLAAHDPENPEALLELAELSLRLYPAYLEQLCALSGIAVESHTTQTLQASYAPGALDAAALARQFPGLPLNAQVRRFSLLEEHSLDPRELAAALLQAACNAGVLMRSNEAVLSVTETGTGIALTTTRGAVSASQFIDCSGAWAASNTKAIVPVKGQMLAVHLPPGFALDVVVRTPDVYVVPRKPADGVRRAIIGATLEEAGFDWTVHDADIATLKAHAAELFPSLRNPDVVEAWAGIRPGTRDGLPLIGPVVPPHGRVHHAPAHWIAAGHYRNGILLAPATAWVIAQLLSGQAPGFDLAPFDPARFKQVGSPSAP
jgi:glycine oxidase